MKSARRSIVGLAAAAALVIGWTVTSDAGGLGGRGGGGRANFGGARPNVGGARPNFSAPRPNFNAPRPNFNAPRPNVSRPNFNNARPNFNTPNRLPTNRPPASMPHLGGNGGVSRPNFNLPGNARPGATFPGSTRPGASRPNVSRPTQLPDRGNALTRPGTLPGRTPGNVRPGNTRPSMPDFGKLPGGRPSSGELGDFLGIDNPLRPGSPSTRPGIPSTRPGRPSTLPGNTLPNRPNRPEGSRPGATRPGNRPGLAVRPDPSNRLPVDRRPAISIGDVNIGNNTVISNRPNWANIDNDRINSINQRWKNQIDRPSTLPYTPRDQIRDWGDSVRDRWYGHRYPGYFRPDWWSRHQFRCGGWHYFYRYSYYPYTYWWSTPTFPYVRTWFTWGAPASSWQQPVYYDYGTGGNVTYQDNSVHINGQPVATADEFAQSAATLATVPEPDSQSEAEQAEWMPLGTFALATDPDDVDPSRIVQLAVNREGVISGTLYNRETDQTQAIQGRVDKETQRVAFRIGESEDVIAETGLYNLTQDEASLLVHFGTETRDNYLLVRLPSPEEPTAEN